MSTFVQHYLSMRGYANNATSSATVKADALSYPGRRPVKRTDLEAYLDKVYADRKARK